MAEQNKIFLLSRRAQYSHGSTVRRNPLDPSDFGKSNTEASWLSPTGLARSLPTNIRDVPHTINNNSLRSKRASGFTIALGEGGQSYNAAVNLDNFVEERADKMYSSGTVPSIVRCKKMYQTEAMKRQNEALPFYRQALVCTIHVETCSPRESTEGLICSDTCREALATQGLAAKVVPGQDHRSRHRVKYAPDYIQYASEGFKRGVQLPVVNTDPTSMLVISTPRCIQSSS
jgi:hypothetical protein